MRLSEYTVISDTSDNSKAILFNGCTGAIDIVSRELVDALDGDGFHGSLHFNGISKAAMDYLRYRGHVVDERSNQREIVRHLNRRLHKRNQNTSGFFLIPTYSCQMRCYYCCQRGRRALESSDNNQKMSVSMVDAAFLAMRRLNVNRIRSLNLYGGEPFQIENYDLIRRIVELSHQEGYLLAAITNGLESKDFADLIGPNKINGVCLTLYGSLGAKEWNRFIKNVETFLSRKAFIAVRINIDKETITQIGELFLRAQRHSWFSHSRLSWNICPILPPQLPAPFDVIQPEEYASAILKLIADKSIPSTVEFDMSAGRQLSGILERGILLPVHPRHPAFCGSKQGIYVFDPYGDLYTCHEAVNDPSFKIGKYFPSLRINEASARYQAQSHIDSCGECLSCPYVLLCDSGCIHRGALRPTVRSSFYCRWVNVSMKLALRAFSDKTPITKHYKWL